MSYILVIDDDWMNREMMEAHLDAEGYTVRLASSGKSALEAIAASQPALIILDLRMPEMDGIEVCEQIRASEDSRNTPILMISGMESDADVQRGLAAGADDFLIKPFNTLLMLARVNLLMRISTLQDEIASLRGDSS